jgi:5-methylcytosine-specific restriction endonuclease McrA
MREYLRKRTAEYRARGESYRGRWRTPEQRAALDELPRDPEKRRKRKQESWQRRRAQKLMAPYEVFQHREIYERDGWICGLCNRPVDPALQYPDPWSATLDHIIPLSPVYRGTHTRDNVQLAHKDCNERKGDRLDWKLDDYPEAAPEPR